jgi:hypothetical protein
MLWQFLHADIYDESFKNPLYWENLLNNNFKKYGWIPAPAFTRGASSRNDIKNSSYDKEGLD